MINNRFVALAAVSLAAVVAATSGAHAGAFAVREQSATAQGMSFAGAASGSGGISSMFWNPATVTMKPGWNSEFHASFIIPESTIDPAPGTSPFLAFPPGSGNFIGSGDIGKEALVPASYTSYQLSDNVWLGLSTSAPFGLVTKPEPVWSGQIYARTSKVFSLNLNPIVGVKLTDWLSVAAGPAIQYFDVRLRSASSFLATAPTTTLEGDDVGVGATAGALLTLPTNTQIGVGFRSAIRHELWGEIESQSPRREVPIEAKLTLPETVTVGLSQAFTPYFRVHAGFEWTNWSRLSSPDVIGPVGLITELVLNYKDGYFYSGGAEYDLSRPLDDPRRRRLRGLADHRREPHAAPARQRSRLGLARRHLQVERQALLRRRLHAYLRAQLEDQHRGRPRRPRARGDPGRRRGGAAAVRRRRRVEGRHHLGGPQIPLGHPGGAGRAGGADRAQILREQPAPTPRDGLLQRGHARLERTIRDRCRLAMTRAGLAGSLSNRAVGAWAEGSARAGPFVFISLSILPSR